MCVADKEHEELVPPRNATAEAEAESKIHRDYLEDLERKRSEAAAQHLAAIVKSSDDAIISKDLNGIITSWNRGAEAMFGYTAAEIIGKSVKVLIPTDREAEETTILRRVRQGEAIEHYETVRRRKDGALIDVSLSVSSLKDTFGRIVGASKIARDITQRKRTELQQRSLSELVAAVNRSASLEEIFDEALTCIFRCQNVDRGSIRLRDPDGAMRFRAWRGLSDDYRQAMEGHSLSTPGAPPCGRSWCRT